MRDCLTLLPNLRLLIHFQITEDKNFKKLIKDMTIDKENTKFSSMRKISARDKRTSAQASGGIALFILIGIISVIVLIDLTNCVIDT